MSGKLIVFEGPDGTGKTTLIESLYSDLKFEGFKVEKEWFPGQRAGSLGELVYRLHHEKDKIGVESFTAAALQAMHIAAHLDLIETVISPFIEDGGIIILDRYWWSTWVYGITFGVKSSVLEHLVLSEQKQWADLLPCTLFLIERERSLKNENLPVWEKLRQQYSSLYEKEKSKYPCFKISNEGRVEDSYSKLKSLLGENLTDEQSAAGQA